jgi:cytidylate kinase
MTRSGRAMIITIDGPAGAGKTTVSRILADRLGYRYIDTGALYRGVALKVSEEGIDPENDDALEELCRSLTLAFEKDESGLRLMSGNRDITDFIRTQEIAMLASTVSARPVVRRFLLKVQRDLADSSGVVAEGRDMGTVVFPRADAKFYLDASTRERALRRYRETAGTHPGVTLEQIEADMIKRDHNDSTRDLAPLKPADDAVRIDSSSLSIDQVIELMLSHVNKITIR